jgi:MFS family permease
MTLHFGLAVVISTKFFPADNPTAAFMATLATFAVGFVVTIWSLFFGRLGDLIGRKYTFMVTLLLMGGNIPYWFVPSYETIGFMAPVLVLILRMLRCLALGRNMVSRNLCHRDKRILDFLDSNNSNCRFFISLMVILATRNILSPEQFDEWDGEFRSGSLLLW